MTRYTVVWLKSAQDKLAQFWLDASDQQGLADAADSIDSSLANDPTSKGTHLSEGLYSLDRPPLRVLYSVSEADRLVEVADVRLLPPPSSLTSGNGQGKSA